MELIGVEVISLVLATICLAISAWVIKEIYGIKCLIRDIIIKLISQGNHGNQSDPVSVDEVDEKSGEKSPSLPWGDSSDEEFLEDQDSDDLTCDQLVRRSQYRSLRGQSSP